MRVRGPGFRDVLGIGEFRALWAAELFSTLGDQLARVALALLVFQRTSSAALAALTYALTFAPAILGGALLSGLADRYPRRRVLVITDLLRAALATTMAIPSLPLPALWVLVGLLSMAAPPFKAAQLALLPQILAGDRYVIGLSLRQITGQSAQLVGFASGGLLVAAVEPHVALAVNAATFLVSAVFIVLGVRPRPAAMTVAGAGSESESTIAPGAPRLGSRRLLPVVAMFCLAGLFVVPEGVAAPYGSALGVGSFGVGLLMAADPLGSVIGAWLIAHIQIRPTRVSVVTFAALSGVPLVLCAAGPGLVVSITLWAMSGAMSTAYLIHGQAIVVQLVPDRRRGRVMGRISTCLYASQGLAIVCGGIAAEATGPFRAVAGAGLLGIVLVLCVGAWWRRVARSRRDLVTGSERGSEQRTADSHISLLDMTDTSSGASSRVDVQAGGHISLLRTANTSRLEAGQDQLGTHISLLRTTGSSHRELEQDKVGDHISLLRMSGTSRREELGQDEAATDCHISLLDMEGTSSQPGCGDEAQGGPFTDGAFRSGNRRLGTRAPSLWWWALRTAGGRLTAGRMATR